MKSKTTLRSLTRTTLFALIVALPIVSNSQAVAAPKATPSKGGAKTEKPVEKNANGAPKQKNGLDFANNPDFGKLPTYIKADSLVLKQQERNFMYQGNVESKHGDMTIVSNTLEGNYDQQNRIQQLIAKTNVLITKGDTIRGTCERAIYEAAKDTVTLTENPELTQNGSVLTGDTIVIYLKENRSEATGQVRVKMVDKKLGENVIGQAAGKS